MNSRTLSCVLAIGVVGFGCGSDADSGAVVVGDGALPAPVGAAGAPQPIGGDAAQSSTTDQTTLPTDAAGSAGAGSPQSVEGDPSQPVAANALPATGTAISPECQGFDFSGLIYSPGGTALPNKCEAFHPTLNNPYAVRCIDAWPWWQTEFPGDQFCILPPPPGQGIQIGHHPQGTAWFEQVSQGDMSGYTNIAPSWMLAPGGEEERNINVQFQNEAGNFYRVYSRMRGGSHHMIVSSIDPPAQTDTWALGGADGLFTGRGLPGAQRPDENGPQSLEKPAEDAGLYREFPANALITYNMHHFNSTDSNILKEAWQNLWWESDATIRVGSVDGLPLLQAVGTFAQPGQTVDMHYASTVPEPTRILALFGHRHAWTTNFTAWVERPGAQPEIVYQSFDWFDEPTYTYNSQVQNNPPNPEGRIDGAHSGILNLDVGDELHFNCHIEYTQERAVQENSPVLPAENGALRFSNQAFAGEMCILFGSAVGNNGSMMPMGPPPDFATVD